MPLVAKDNSWCVCMPKKTGSHSLVGMTESIASVVGDWHGCDWEGAGQRYLVVREPQERLASLYWYSQAHGGGAWGDRGVVGWCERFTHMNQRRSEQDFEWWAPQSEYAKRFRPDQVFRLEDGLDRLLTILGLPDVPMQHRNQTKSKNYDRKRFAETFHNLPCGLMRVLQQWLDRDKGNWYK